MVDGPSNLRKFHLRKRDKSHLKDPYFLCLKTLRNGMNFRQDRYPSLHRISNLSPFGNLSHGVSFSVDLRDGSKNFSKGGLYTILITFNANDVEVE